MTLQSTRSALGAGQREHPACDVVTEVEPRPGGHPGARLAAVIGLRARARVSS